MLLTYVIANEIQHSINYSRNVPMTETVTTSVIAGLKLTEQV